MKILAYAVIFLALLKVIKYVHKSLNNNESLLHGEEMINGNVGGVALKFQQENPTDMDLQEQLEMILTRNVAERQNTANAIVEVIKQTASHGNDEEKSLALKIYNETPNLI